MVPESPQKTVAGMTNTSEREEVLNCAGFYDLRVGEQSLVNDVRIVAATNQNLQQRVRAGLFREDLFYRLNVLPIEMPRLTTRVEDIPILVNQFVHRFAAKNKQLVPTIALEYLILKR
jgi:DNA-binding NtrC family response regulator